MSSNKSDMKTSSLDPVLRKIGNFGRWQAKTIGIVMWAGLFNAWNMLSISFLVPSGVPFWCSQNNTTISPNINRSHVLSNTYSNSTKSHECLLAGQFNSSSTCVSWEFDRSTYSHTVISEFNLVCDREYLVSLSQSIYMSGIMMGSVGSGILSDKYGRKRIIVVSCWLIMVFGVVASQSSSILFFIIARWCLAVCNISAFICSYVYCMEMVGGRWSTFVGSGLMFPWALGFMTIPMLSWAFPSWRDLQLAITLPIILYIIPVSIPSLVPESPRWMLFNGNQEQATSILISVAESNGRTTSVKSESQVNHNSWPEQLKPPTKPILKSLVDLLGRPTLRLRSLIMFNVWFTNSFVYYGLTLNSGSLIPGDLHVNFIIGGLLEFVAYGLTTIALLRLGRRWSLGGTMILGGLSLLLTALVPDLIGKAACAQIGKFLITGSFSMMFVYATELFPTVVRNVGVGCCSMFARIGGMLAPYIGRELGLLSKEAPIVIYGVTCLVVGVMVALLPETKDRILPDTIEEGELFGKKDCGKERTTGGGRSL